jgi:2,4-dienoyl-CoA reductase-like NADH-dependent reductase (Old Yellow Enzyme family)
MTLPNRFVRSATWEGLATEDGSVTPELIEVQRQLARGAVGLIISGHAYVSREGQAGMRQLGAYSDALIPGLTAMTEAIHESGGKAALQLAHAGSRAAFKLTGLSPMGPSETEEGREMTGKDMRDIAGAFARAAERARIAGFDAVQVHAAHGYLLSQYLSPCFNKRTDGYGGAIENRTQLLIEVINAVREAVGPEFPILVKLNSEDFLPNGLTTDDMFRVAAFLEQAGIDAIEMSGGTVLSGKYLPSRPGKPAEGEPEAYYEPVAETFKRKLPTPLMLVGGIRTLETAERLVDTGITDYIALCRPLIREPDLVARWRSGDHRPARCVSDNGCFAPGFEGKGVYCVVEEQEKRGSDKGHPGP